MRILHVITSLNTGGAEKLMVDILPRIREAGNETDLLVFDGKRTPFRKELENQGIRIIDCGEGRSVYNPLNIIAIRRLIKDYDVVHTHNTSPQFFAVIASLGKKVKLVTTEHNTSNRRRNLRWFAAVDKWMYNHYDRIICISDKAEENLKGYINLDKGNIITIHNGVDVSKFYNASPSKDLRVGLRDEAKIIIMVAAFRHQKNQDCLIKAMDCLPDKYHLFLVGEGERKQDCEKLAQSQKSSDRIHFLGRRGDIAELLKASDFVVLSSHYEGLSLSSIEGMAAGKPFIASDVDGLHEIVWKYGVLFEDGDFEMLAGEIINLEEHQEVYKKVATSCYERAKQFDIEKMVKGYMNVYSKLL